MNGTREYARDSFDRFGDDLVDELFAYLSLGQRFACECVSKQWSRLVFNRQRRLDIDGRNPFGQTSGFWSRDTSAAQLNSITKKCALISEICIDNYANREITSEIIDTITANCRRVTALSVKTNCGKCTVSRDSWRAFANKFGHCLRRISLFNVNQVAVKTVLRLATNLEDCEINNVNDFLEQSSSREFLPKLKSISAKVYKRAKLEAFADRYSKRVERIAFRIKSNTGETRVNAMFDQLCRFERLASLRVEFKAQTNVSIEILNKVGLHCRQLTRLSMSGAQNCVLVLRNTRVKFASLKHLTLTSLINFDKNLLSFCPNLAALKLHTNYTDNDIFDGVDQSAPNLISIELYACHTKHINDTTLQHLSRLKQLRSLSLVSRESQITSKGLSDFFGLNSGVKRLAVLIALNSSATVEIINTFVDLAQRNPKLSYSLSTETKYNNQMVKVLVESRELARNRV